MKSILILHGPNLNLLGQREIDIYGNLSLEEVNKQLVEEGKKIGLSVHTFQSNIEGELINAIHDAQNWADGVIFNPAGFSHTSVALRDAVSGINLPVIEVHISNVYSREKFRHKSLIAPVCIGQITGFGWQSYVLALYAFKSLNQESN